MTKHLLLTAGAIGLAAASSSAWWAAISPAEAFEVTHSDADWRKLLTPDQYAVCGAAAERNQEAFH
jgi:peptide-methionine (R)-S-oxide reductase